MGQPSLALEMVQEDWRRGEEVVKWRDVLLAVHTCAGVSGPAASRGSPACPPLLAAGVKSWLEAGGRGRILSVDRRNMMACQICSSLICLVTVTNSGSQTQARLSPPFGKALFCLQSSGS